MAGEEFKVGTLFISHEVLQHEKWLIDAAITAAQVQMRKYKGLHGFLKPSPIRKGDFSLILASYKMSPAVATWIGIPGRTKPPIIQELFVAS